MLEFRKAELSDKDFIKQLLRSTKRENCEYCFGNIFSWGSVYGTRIAVFNDFLICRGFGKNPAYAFPMGQGDLKSVIDAVMADSKERNERLRFYGVTESDKEALTQLYPDRFTFEEDRSFFDYIYSREKLSALSGKKYHSKRNHIAAFEMDNDWSYEEITDRNISECFEMNEKWLAFNTDKDPVEINNERTALVTSLENFNELELTGALLRKGGQVVAFTIGEEMNEKLFCTHFEKAFADIRGAYPMINREFAKRTLTQYEYINREEDTGDEGLRKAKMSYKPEKLLTKYTAVINE